MSNISVMKPDFRLLLSALVLALAACGEPEQPAAPAAPLPADPSAQVRVVMPISSMSPDWIEVARQRDCPLVGEQDKERCPYGSVHYNRQTITRSVDGTVANIWTQTTHGAPQLFQAETETTTLNIRFTHMRLLYRFHCNEGTFAIIERQIMGDDEAVMHREQPPELYRQPVRWSAVPILMRIACQGGTLQP
jgi:hypothetical protein